MDPPGPDERPQAHLLFGRIDALLAALGAQGLKVDIEQRVRLNGFLLGLVAQGRLPDDPDALVRLITPIIAGSPAQQALCETTIKAALAGKLEQPIESHRSYSTQQDNASSRWGDGGWLMRGSMSFAAVLILAAVLSLAWLVGFGAKPLAVSGGSNTIPSSGTVATEFDWIKNYPINEFEPPQQAPWNRTLRWYYTEYNATKWIALLLPWVLYLGFLVFLYHQLLAHLRREAAKQNLRSLEWRLGDVNGQFGNRRLIGELQPLRMLARAHLHVFDPERTALASAESAGLLRPRFKQVAVPTDFVVLIDRQSERDHLAAYGSEVVRSLRNVGLSLEVLEFNRDPALCHDVRRGEFVRLDAVVRRFRDSVLLIFAAAEQLIDPARGTLLGAAVALRDSRRAVLLTPESGGAESELARSLVGLLGIAVLPATTEGVRELVQLLVGARGTAKPRSDAPEQPAAGLLAFFADRPGRWMQVIAPRAIERRLLRDHLRTVLSPHALRWLAATAVYPQLRWPLTLSLKAATAEAPHARRTLDGELLAVVQLPWFRSGWMPEWTRRLLQEILPKGDQSRVRRTILECVGLTGRRSVGEHVEIGLDQRRERPNEHVRADSVMLDYLLPALGSARGLFALPKSWVLERLRKPLRRLAAVAVAGMLFAAALSTGALSLLPIDECDLLAASGLDNLRVGPATETIIIRTFFRDRALKACQDAVRRERNNGRFWLNLARVFDDQTEYAAALESALKSAGLNYPAGYNAVGYQFDNRPPPLGPDLRLAKVYFERSLRLGNKYSLFNLAALAYREGDFAREFRLMTEYKDAGGYRLARLALFYARGASNPRGAANIVPEDAKKYIELLELGVRRRGDTHTYLAYELSLGLHVPQDLARSNELDETSVRLWHEPVSAANLSSYYFDADHAWQNEEKSTYWAIYAAKLGNARGLSILADLIASGRARFKPGYGPPDSFDILEIREKLAEGADATAAFKLAKDFEARGNRSKAVSWYQRAASKGHSEAEEALQRLKSE